MADQHEAATMAAVASAVSGPDTPAAARVQSAPQGKAVVALVLAGPALSAMIIAAAAAVVFIFWPDLVRLKAIAVMERAVIGMFSLASVLAGILGVVVFRMASGGLKKVTAQAGPAGVTIEGGDDAA